MPKEHKRKMLGVRRGASIKRAKRASAVMRAEKKAICGGLSNSASVDRPREDDGMAQKLLNESIDDLIGREAWSEARDRIEIELADEPDNHWLLTQLAVTLYEEGLYREALRPLSRSLQIVPDCPLTLWNLAGTLDALGESVDAIRIYLWILNNSKGPEDDPCWESLVWTESLQVDCVYRLGESFGRLGDARAAEVCYRRYIDLGLAGLRGSYSLDDASDAIQDLRPTNGTRKLWRDVRRTLDSTIRGSAIRPAPVRSRKPPKIALDALFAT